MPKRIRCKKIKIKWTKWRMVGAIIAMILSGFILYGQESVEAVGCPDIKVIFARGSGGERYKSGDYLAFREAMEEKLKTTELTYEFEDLDYLAVSIDIMDGHLRTLLGAYFGGGDAYEFGDSVHQGTDELLRVINNSECKNTKYVLGGYSQGAMVVLNGLKDIKPGKIIYVATFGDPKIYLPEGAGLVPAACGGSNLSEYRIYVPDCRAHKGILGAKNPYVVSGYEGKVGTWCNKFDIMCSSYFSVNNHTSYESDGLYEDASRFIFSKIGAEFGISNQYTSPHDTAILIDSTASMSGLIGKYKAEAMRLAEKTLEAGGRVALYDYRDLSNGYVPVERCDFETCILESFRQGLDEIEVGGGGDFPESLLSASFHVMKKLSWKRGSTKSLVVLTDAGYHSPDLDGTTLFDVRKLSKEIDPVNFYIITEESEMESYRELAEATDGAVASSVDDLSILTDTIMERYDSLPRVEEEYCGEECGGELPVLTVLGVEGVSDGGVKVSFESTGSATIVILNEAILGTTYEKEITITGLKDDVKNVLTLVPISETKRGDGVMVELSGFGGFVDDSADSGGDAGGVKIPKAPNTGRGM